ncbi:MAG: PAS domain S-box protein [Candidatus Atribacteria bacterium]|nr:PAS domain S-box protein [Candidatus Atribacteria bacterium]
MFWKRTVKKSREYSENIIDTIREPLIVLDQDLRVITASRSFYEFFKVNPKETVGQLIYDLGNKQWDIPKLRELLETILPQKTTFDNYEVEHDFATIGRRLMLLNARQIQRVLGKERIILLAIEDITELKQIEDDRKKLEIVTERANIIDVMPDGLTISNMKGTIIIVNKAFIEITGFKEEEIVGKQTVDLFKELVKPDDNKRVLDSLNAVLREETTPTIEFTIISKSGKETTFARTTSIVKNSAGTPQKIIAIFNDITRRKLAEQDLKRSNIDLEKFAYVASHDLQEPLRMMASYISLLEKRYKDKLDSDANDFISFIVDGAKRMQQLINDLLAFSRAGASSKPFENIDMESVLKIAELNLGLAIKESKAKITWEPLPVIKADEAQMVQIFQNLIDNAIKFRDKEPPIIHISAKQEESDWIFWVKDNGIGIDPKYFDRIFLIFQRLHNRDKYPGTGIGLAIVKRIVESYGGRVWIESELQKGSTFYFTIPKKVFLSM